MNSNNLFMACVVLIFYYTQDVTLYHVDIPPYSFPFLESFLNTEFIHEIYSLNVAALQAIGQYTCVFKNISPIGKLLLNVSIYPFIFLLFGIIYCLLICIRSQSYISRVRAERIKGNLASGFVLVAMLAYQRMIATALKLVNCVEVHESVLLIDSKTKCIDTMPVWTFIAFCLIPFPLYLMFASINIDKNRLGIAAFLLGLICPGLYFICLGLVVIWQAIAIRDHTINGPHHDVEHRALLANYPNAAEIPDPNAAENPHPNSDPNPNLYHNPAQNHDPNPAQNHDPNPAQNHDPNHDLGTSLCKQLQGGYEVYLSGWLNWIGVVMLLRMTLIFSSIFIHDPLSRIVTMLVISFASFTMHTLIKPCKHQALNILAIVCHAAIITVAICYLILATLLRNQYQPAEADPLSPVLNIIIYIFSVLVPASCIVVVIIDSIIAFFVFLVLGFVNFIKVIALAILYTRLVKI